MKFFADRDMRDGSTNYVLNVPAYLNDNVRDIIWKRVTDELIAGIVADVKKEKEAEILSAVSVAMQQLNGKLIAEKVAEEFAKEITKTVIQKMAEGNLQEGKYDKDNRK
jgi:UDP:flavonoid glycosyltransferase YjiC (YdhE family)